MKLTKKLTTILASIVATTCAVLGIVTLKPSDAFAANENNVARFYDTAYYAINSSNYGETYNSQGIFTEWRIDTSNYHQENIKVSIEISLFELQEVHTGIEKYDKELKYSNLVDGSNFTKLETFKVDIKKDYREPGKVKTETKIDNIQTNYNAVTMQPLIYVYEDPWRSVDLKTYFNSFKDYDITDFICEDGYISFYIAAPSNLKKYVLATSVSIVSYEYVNLKLQEKSSEEPYKSVSPIRSVAECLNDQVNNNILALPTCPPEEGERLVLKAYNNIVANALDRSFTVYYLVPIAENVPFAKKVSKNIDVRLSSDGVINATDICAAVGVDYFEIFGTIYNGIEQKGDTLTIKYPCDYWLATKTMEGKVSNHFLDINLSYQEYFHKFVEGDNAPLSQGVYEYLFATAIGNPYPEVAKQGLSYDDVYGYWDYVVLPDTKSIDQILTEVLGNNDTTIAGITKEFHFTDQISRKAYDKLYDEFNYTYLDHVWKLVLEDATLSSPYTATHYMLVCDPLAKDGFVDESGSGNKDPDGGKKGQIMQDISDWFEGMGKDLASLGTDWTKIQAGKGTFKQYFILGAGGVVVLGVFIIIFYVRSGKLGNSINSSIRRNKNKWRK